MADYLTGYFPTRYWPTYWPVYGSPVFPGSVGITVLVDGVEVTDYVVPRTLKITNILTNQVDTCSFTLDPVPAGLSLADWMEVLVYDGPIKLFGGYLLTNDGSHGSDLLRMYDASCSDYSVRLGTVRVSREYYNSTDKTIIADLFATYLASEGFDASTFVSALLTHGRLRYVNKYMVDVLRDLAKLSGGDWYIDPDKNVRYFSNEAALAPFAVSDNPDMATSFPYSAFSFSQDGAGVANRVRVVGGTYYSGETTITVRGNGTDKRLTLPAKFRSGLQVWRNDGTDEYPIWTSLTMLAGYLDSLTDEDQALYFYQDKVIEILSPWPALNLACKVTGTYEVPTPLTVEMTDSASYAFYGRWFDHVIRDKNIVDRTVAMTRAAAKLAEAGLAKVVIKFTTRQPGLRAGQLLHVTNALFSVSGTYLIQRITATMAENNAATFAVECGVYSADLIDYLMAIAKNNGDEQANTETLYELLTIRESITLGGETNSLTPTTGPYRWGTFRWGFGKWG
jgi:hypothetical protein